MKHRSFARSAGWLATAGLVGVALVTPASTLATQPGGNSGGDHKVTICHATNSDTNQYVVITVDIASSGYVNHGHSDHTGPIWDATLKDRHLSWGDIIPSYTYNDFTYPGRNNSSWGLQILANGCVIPTPTTTPTDQPTTTPTDAPTQQPEVTPTPTDQPTTTPTDAPTQQPEVTPTPTATPTGGVEGATSMPKSTPIGGVKGATGAPELTPPSTDTIGSATPSKTGSSWQLLLLGMAGILATLLLMTPVASRRRS